MHTVHGHRRLFPGASGARLARHPGTLFCAVVLGLWLGVLWPAAAPLFAALAGIYLALLQAVALPFIVLAVYSGLQRLAAPGGAGRPGRPWLVVALTALLATPLCALGGALLGGVIAAGAGLDGVEQAALGLLARESAPVSMDLFGADAPATAAAAPPLVPHNLYAVLAAGALPSALIGVLLFGTAVAVARRAQGGAAADRLGTIVEAAYRALEAALGSLNAGLPLIALVLAAAAGTALGQGGGSLLFGFLGVWLAAALLACAAALALLGWRTGMRPWALLTALREALTVCLCAPAGAAALPEFIEALATRLGFNRAAAEVLMPVAPAFLRSGEAMFFAVIAVFAADLYGHPLAARELALLVGLSCWSAFGNAGPAGTRSLLWAGMLQETLGLPVEALLPALATVEAVCAGPRNLVSYLWAAVLVSLAPGRAAPRLAQALPGTLPAPLQLALPRRQVWLGAALLVAGLLAIFAAGVGLGLRRVLLVAT